MELNPHWFRIINTMNEGLMIVGTDGKILMVNQAFEALTGFSESEVLGKPCTLLHCDACERILQQGEARLLVLAFCASARRHETPAAAPFSARTAPAFRR